ncbi:MAG TPA: hemolysin family protein [Longimicrobiales bacterium]|nr:hemolysin family protein [Longimicrobiales bacterium]
MSTLVAVIGLSLAISFMCSILEAVLLSTTHAFVGVLKDRGERAGRILARMRDQIDEPIAAILTLNTIAHTVGASVGGALALQVFGSEWIALFSALLTLAILVLSEILPKTIGATYWKALARPAAYVLSVMVFVMKPILVPLSLVNRLISPKGEPRPTISRAELEVLAEIGRREGALDEEEWRLVTNVMHLERVRVGEVMTPRTQIVAVPVEATVEDAKLVMIEEGHLRIPVYEETIDRIVGILLARDLWSADLEGVTDLREVMRPPRFVPESKPVEDLIREMRRERIKMAIVLDEFGGTAGLVTLEDLIEEIVGEIQDEHEIEPPPFEQAKQGEIYIAGNVAVWEVNERFGLDLPEDMYDTIGGFVFGELGRVARVGDEVRIPQGRFRVEAMDGRRIARLSFVPEPEAASEEG